MKAGSKPRSEAGRLARWLLACFLVMLGLRPGRDPVEARVEALTVAKEERVPEGRVAAVASGLEAESGEDPGNAVRLRSPGRDVGSGVEVSPRLDADIRFLKAALEEGLEGQPPMARHHACLVANWVFNLMLDAAYQDAVDLGREPDPERALRQVLQVLEVRR